jgi:hypothetical protein
MGNRVGKIRRKRLELTKSLTAREVGLSVCVQLKADVFSSR